MSITNLKLPNGNMERYTTALQEMHGGGAFRPKITPKASQYYNEMVGGITDGTWRGLSILPGGAWHWIKYTSSNGQYITMGTPAGIKTFGPGHWSWPNSIRLVSYVPEQGPKGNPGYASPGNLRAILGAAARGMIRSTVDAATGLGEAAANLPGFSASLFAATRGNLNGLLGMYTHGRSIVDALGQIIPDPANYQLPPNPPPDVEWVVCMTNESLGDGQWPNNSTFSNVVDNSNSNNNNPRITNNTVNNNNYGSDVDNLIYNIQNQFDITDLPKTKSALDKFADALDAAGKIAGLAQSLGDLLRSKYSGRDPNDSQNQQFFADALQFIADTLSYMFEEMWDSIPDSDDDLPDDTSDTIIKLDEESLINVFDMYFMDSTVGGKPGNIADNSHTVHVELVDVPIWEVQ